MRDGHAVFRSSGTEKVVLRKPPSQGSCSSPGGFPVQGARTLRAPYVPSDFASDPLHQLEGLLRLWGAPELASSPTPLAVEAVLRWTAPASAPDPAQALP